MARGGSKRWVPSQSFAIFFADTGTVNQDSVENPETDMEEQLASKDDVDGDGKYTVYPR